MGAFGGFLSGMGNGVQAKQKQDKVGPGNQAPGTSFGGLLPMMTGQKPQQPMGTPPFVAPQSQPSTAIPNPAPGQQQHGFNGLIPMMKGYYAAHQAKVQDATAKPHIDSLADPSLTPEQQAYHLSNLQSIYAGRPEMLKQYGIQSISLGQPQGAPNSYTPTVQPVNLGQDRSRTSMTVTSPGATGIGDVATER